MIKELLIFLLLCQDSNGVNKNDSIKSFEELCLSEGGQLLDRWKRVCIPSKFLGILLLNPETKDNKTHILQVTMSKLQIIKIGEDTITLSMGTQMHWLEKRLKINVEGFKFQLISLSKEDQEQIWSPDIVIRNNMVSIIKEGEKLGLAGFGKWVVAHNEFSLTTTMNCEMDFQTFPFDKHTCEIEVSYPLFGRSLICPLELFK